jgi:hypothetical protein
VEKAVSYVIKEVNAQVKQAERLRFQELLECFDSLYASKMRADLLDENTIQCLRYAFAEKHL